jgi:hypothetical protein
MIEAAEEKALIMVKGFAGAQEVELRSEIRVACGWDANSTEAAMLGEDFNATVLEKHVNEWCLSLAEKAALIQL